MCTPKMTRAQEILFVTKPFYKKKTAAKRDARIHPVNCFEIDSMRRIIKKKKKSKKISSIKYRDEYDYGHHMTKGELLHLSYLYLSRGLWQRFKPGRNEWGKIPSLSSVIKIPSSESGILFFKNSKSRETTEREKRERGKADETKFTSIKRKADAIYVAGTAFLSRQHASQRRMRDIGSEFKRANGNKLHRENFPREIVSSCVSVCMENWRKCGENVSNS